MVDSLNRNKCTGCKACGDICPKAAITFETDGEGFWYPVIDSGKCTRCGMCDRVCPSVNSNTVLELDRDTPKAAYETVNKNDEVRIKSTSGGVYYAFAEYVISNGGVIAGCVYDDDWYGAHHVIGKNTEDLNKIYGSKYFQSDTANIYRLVKEKLDNNIEVLFCGAPCQVAGLYGYLNGDSDNLTTVDFICRGINSPKAYRAYMLELEKKYKSRIRKVHFKDKTQGWTNLGTKVEFENGRTYFRNRNTDPWVNGFIVGSLYMRPSCSQCEYRRFPRVADITVGDFWGLDFSKEDARKGVSVVLCNSKKGSELLKECKSCFNIKEHDLDTAVNGNPALVKSIPMSEHRKEFFDNVDSESYSSLVWRLVGLTSPKRQIIYMKFIIKQKIRHFIKR